MDKNKKALIEAKVFLESVRNMTHNALQKLTQEDRDIPSIIEDAEAAQMLAGDAVEKLRSIKT